jgi:hypothetical protein
MRHERLIHQVTSMFHAVNRARHTEWDLGCDWVVLPALEG